MATTNLDFLIFSVRLRIGDTDSTSYRYLDKWVETALLDAVKFLGRWWNFKYLVNSSKEVYRNPNHKFLFPEPPVVEAYDETPIIIVASLLILEGSLENSAWSFGSWKDAEIAFSNIESAKTRNSNVARLWNELLTIMTPPGKRLARPQKASMPGYKDNPYEVGQQ